MRLKTKVVGKHICLRTALEEDAEFILTLRLNPQLNKFIGTTDPSIEKQRKWIRQKQEAQDDYHMIIEDHKGNPLGTIAVYSINQEQRTFEWGRWIVAPGSSRHVALESAFLVYYFSFYILDLQTAIFGTRKNNVSCSTSAPLRHISLK